MDPDQTAPLISVHTVCLYAKIGLKSLQEYSADGINRQHFQMQVFLTFLRVKVIKGLSHDMAHAMSLHFQCFIKLTKSAFYIQ